MAYKKIKDGFVTHYYCDKCGHKSLTIPDKCPCCSERERSGRTNKYIDVTTLKEQMLAYGFHSVDQTVSEFVEDTLPTTDVTEVVKCKDCKYFSTFVDPTGNCLLSKGLVEVDDNTYCSYGKRRKK